MNWNVINAVIGTVAGGGLIIYAFNKWDKMGATILDSHAGDYYYKNIFGEHIINKFVINLQFINKSGYDRIIKIKNSKYYDGEILHDLFIDSDIITPAEKIEPKAVKLIKATFYPSNEIIAPIPVLNEYSYLEIRYIVNSKEYLHTIMGVNLNGYSEGGNVFADAMY